MRRAGPSTASGWAVLVGLLGLGAVELVRGLVHLLAEDSGAALAGLAAASAGDADVVHLFALVGGVQAVLGGLLLTAALALSHLRAVAVVLVAARCAVTLAVGVAKPATADGLVGGGPDAVALVVALVVLVLLRSATRTGRGTGSARPPARR